MCEDYPCCGHDANGCNADPYNDDMARLIRADRDRIWSIMAQDDY